MANQEVEVMLPYIRPSDEEPISHAGYPQLENLTYDWRPVVIASARRIPGGPSLREHGFCAVKQATAAATFDDAGNWKHSFTSEVASLLQQLTGAAEVVIPRETASFRSVQLQGSQAPASFCHNDFTSVGAALHVAQLDRAKAERRLAGRYAAYNVWRLVSPPPQDVPLALCDARSVRSADVVPGKAYYGGPNHTTLFGSMAMFRFNPAHRWYYFPDLGNDELLIWCGYDADPLFASIVPHTAFRDPRCAAGAAPRANVECRCFAFFD